MAKKKKIEERTIEVDRGDDSLAVATTEIKRIAGFSASLPIRGRLISRTKVEYDFFVGDDENALRAELLQQQINAERTV